MVGHTEDVRERTKSVDSEIICFSDGNGWYLSDFKVALLISIVMVGLFIILYCISVAFGQKEGRKFLASCLLFEQKRNKQENKKKLQTSDN